MGKADGKDRLWVERRYSIHEAWIAKRQIADSKASASAAGRLIKTGAAYVTLTGSWTHSADIDRQCLDLLGSFSHSFALFTLWLFCNIKSRQMDMTPFNRR
jgi:hypothetical protein